MVASSGLGHVSRGIEAWAADLGAALVRRGADVTLCKGGGRAEADYERVIPCWQRDSVKADRVKRWLPRSIAWRLGLASGYGIEQTTFALGLIKYLRSERVDLLHVQDPQLAMIVQWARRLGLVRTRTILAHGTEEPISFLRKIEYVQHLSPIHQEECKTAGVWKPAWTALPNFIDGSRFRPGSSDELRTELGIPPDALVVLTAAAIKRKHKRIDEVLEAVAQVRGLDPALPVWLVVAGGREAETDELIELGRKLLGDRVRFLVKFPRERMADLYRSADVFVLGSLKEMMPIALLEATASGLPCIVNRHPVLEWIVGPGGAAIDMAAPGALTKSLHILLKDSTERRRLGAAARQHCMQQFDEEAVVARILGYYKVVLGKRERTASADTSPAKVPTISVVIPAFNSGQWIAQTVESVLAQTVQPSEIIVVDDGSTDDTRRRLAPYMDRIRYLLQANQGVAVARNSGIAAATGELIAFLDADDLWHPQKLEIQLRAMADHPRLGLLGTGAFDLPAPAAAEAGPCGLSMVPWRRLVVKNVFTTSSVMVRRDVLNKVGCFDPELRGPEDFDLWLRIAEAAPVANLKAKLVGYRTVPGSLGRRAQAMEAGLLRIMGKLDARRAWRGNWLLRRKARALTGYSCAYLYAAAGDQRTALSRILGSLAGYPFPYSAREVRFRFGRLRMLTMILRRLPGEHGDRRPA